MNATPRRGERRGKDDRRPVATDPAGVADGAASATTIAGALAEAAALGIDRLDAQLLLGHLFGRPRTWVLAHDEAALSAELSTGWRQLAARRAQREPLAYLVGAKEFHGLTLRVEPGVLVPRPETEVLVERALAILGAAPGREAAPRVVDLGTGSGAIALAVKSAHPGAEMFASDCSAVALEIARANARSFDLDIGFRVGSWWEPWSGQRFDLAVANPPYVADADPHLAALRHEPLLALAAGADGLAALRPIVAGASRHLEPGGWLVVEHGYDQADAVRAMLQAAGFARIELDRDLAGLARCSAAQR